MTREIELPANGWKPRDYQRPLWNYLRDGGRNAVAAWHRRAGKDEIALHYTAIAAHKRVANYWHMLPEYAQARKAIWDAINPHTGRKRLDECFPHELRRKTIQDEMKIEFHCGSMWQVVGSDNFNSLVGSPPVGIVYSEWAVANPMAEGFLAPILAENKGWSLYIYTVRGYNHGHSTYKSAQSDPDSFAQLLSVDDTDVIDPIELQKILHKYVDTFGEEAGKALFRQEFYCDFSAANIGAILGGEIERADKAGRIADFEIDPSVPVELSSDIGFHDTATWWFWQRFPHGFRVIDYDQDSGLDADDWIPRLQERALECGYKFSKVWLPHDAKAKTFQSKHSALERFMGAFKGVDIVPGTSKADRINAARFIAKRTEFHKTNCAKGLSGLRSWSFEWNEETRQFGREPRHDWASHPGDGFSYGAQVMREAALPKEPETVEKVFARAIKPMTFDQALQRDEQTRGRRRV